ncbi:MAG: ATP-dependent DNA ligase [Candidatus Diapherotrites archaeon]
MHFELLAEYFDKIERASERLKMTDLLAELFSKTDSENIKNVVYLSQGQLGPNYAKVEAGLGEKLLMDALAKASGYTRHEIEKQFKEKGDLGLVAEALVAKKKQSSLFQEKLSVKKVFDNLLKIAKAEGPGSQELKLKLMAELLNSALPLEAKFIARIPLENLRLGIGDPTIMDSFALSLVEEGKKEKELVKRIEAQMKDKKIKEKEWNEELNRRIKVALRERIEEKYNIYSDLGEIARILKEKGLGGLEKISIEPGIPIRPTLAERLPSAEEILEKIGKCAVEAKYDGFRLAVHKNKDKIIIFSRQQENMTEMFPEIVEGVKKQLKAEAAVIEGEALAVNEETGEFFPFQVTIQRKRKYEIGEKAKEFPLKLFVFDVMMLNGKNFMNEPFKERRKLLEEIIKKGETIELTESIVTDDPKKINAFFEECVQRGLEGIIAKDLNAKYIAGARKFAWIKLKRSYKGELSDTVDAVIIGYYKGRGKRTQFGLGALLTAVYDDKKDEFKSIAKIGTGMTEEKMIELEKILSKIKASHKPARVNSELEPDFWVEPKYVIEVRADEITKSPVHTAGKTKELGFALRFPRMISIRVDRKPEEATTEKEIIKMYEQQKHVQTTEIREEL